MNKIVGALVAGAMMFSAIAPAAAAFNPNTIEDSASRANIEMLIDEAIEDGKTSGVTGGFAWVSVNGKVYSMHTRHFNGARSNSEAVKIFQDYIQQQVGADIELTINDLEEAQTLFNTIRDAQPSLNIEVVKALVTAQFPDVVFYERIVERVEIVTVTETVTVEVPVVETVTVIEYQDRVVVMEVIVEREVEVADPDAYNEGYAAGVAAAASGVDLTDVNNARSEGYTAGYAAGVASVDITSDNQGSYDAGYVAGVASVDITSDNQASYDAGHAAGVASVTPDDGVTQADVDAAVAAIDITTDNAAAIAAALTDARNAALARIPSSPSLTDADIIDAAIAHRTDVSLSDINQNSRSGQWLAQALTSRGLSAKDYTGVIASTRVLYNGRVTTFGALLGNLAFQHSSAGTLGSARYAQQYADIVQLGLTMTALQYAQTQYAGFIAANNINANDFATGYVVGYDDGYADGYADGYRDGYTDGVNAVN